MKHVLRILPNGDEQIIDASGKPLGKGDADRPILHILPKLLVPAETLGAPDKLLCEDVSLELVSTLPMDLVPEGGFQIRQPYPNQRYFVGGSVLIRNGWIVPLPPDITEFDLEFRWKVESMSLCHFIPTDIWEVHHKLHIRLQAGSGVTYSMDSSCWPQQKAAPLCTSPITTLGIEEVSADLSKRQIIQTADLVYSYPDPEIDDELGGYVI